MLVLWRRKHPVAKKRPSLPRPKAARPKAAEVNGPGDSVAELKTARRTAVDVRLSLRDRVSLYAAAPYLSNSSQQACRLKIPFVTYFKDKAVAQSSCSARVS